MVPTPVALPCSPSLHLCPHGELVPYDQSTQDERLGPGLQVVLHCKQAPPRVGSCSTTGMSLKDRREGNSSQWPEHQVVHHVVPMKGK